MKNTISAQTVHSKKTVTLYLRDWQKLKIKIKSDAVLEKEDLVTIYSMLYSHKRFSSILNHGVPVIPRLPLKDEGKISICRQTLAVVSYECTKWWHQY